MTPCLLPSKMEPFQSELPSVKWKKIVVIRIVSQECIHLAKKHRYMELDFSDSVLLVLQILTDTWAPMLSLHKLSSAVILGVGTVSYSINSSLDNSH